jgi:hypothetical protein
MAVVTIVANVAAADVTKDSNYGNYPWSLPAGVPTNVVGIGAGTKWMVWAFTTGGITAGESFNGIRVQGTNDFTVGGGGAGKTRQAVVYLRASKSFDYAGTTGSSVQTLVATGTGANLNTVLTPSGWSSTDLLNGNVFVGVAAMTNSGDSGQGDGTLRYNAITFTFYTGSDVPSPPAGQTKTTLTNPSGNYTTGKFAGQQFAALDYVLIDPHTNAYFNMEFALPLGLTFVNSGSTNMSLQKGASGDPANPWNASTGLINVAASTKGGMYPIQAQCRGVLGNPTVSGIQTGQLFVRTRRNYHFWEV